MKLAANPFTQAIREGKKQIGLWASLCSPLASDVIAPSGFDWVLVDMEHAPNDYLTVMGQLQVFASSSTTAIVRPEINDPVVVKRLMDLGTPGLLFPMIQSVEEAEKAVASTRYPPRGTRGVAGVTRATQFGRVTDYIERVEEETAVILQLETVAAIEKAEQIAAVDGVSGIFFGPSDIAADIGKVGKPMDIDVWRCIKPAAQKLMEKGVPIGAFVLDADFASDLLNDGFTFVACGMDASLLANASDNLLAKVRGSIKNEN